MKLCELVEILENNEECVVLKVKDNKRLNLIKLGCFDGNEELLRLTKGKNHTCTVFSKNGDSDSWYWGEGGYTLVSKNTEKKGNLIQKCITEDFDIYIGDDKENIKKSLNIKNLSDSAGAKHYIELMYFGDSDNICVHKDNSYYSLFNTIDSALNHFKELGFKTKYINTYIARTGCTVEEYNITRSKELSYHDDKQKEIKNEERSIEIEINNGGTLRVSQTDANKTKCGVVVESIDDKGKIYRRDLINEGDFVMLMNYYCYVKDNDIKDDFINPNGSYKREDIEQKDYLEL